MANRQIDKLTNWQILMDITKEQVEDFIEEVLPLTEREVISYELSPAEGLPITDSKVGGVPYIPKGGALPRTSDGYDSANQLRAVAPKQLLS